MTCNPVTKSCAAIAILIGTTIQAASQSWPSRPIEIAIPFSAGSGMDSIGRAVSASFAEQFGQSVVVINREGAAGTLAFTQLANATPDGYSLAFGPTTPIANAPYLVKGVKYDSESFDYICQVYENVYTAAVPSDSRFKTAQDLIRAARDEPGK